MTIDCDHPFDSVVTEPNVTIVSPNYPKDYDSDSHCAITIRYAERVRLTFLDLSIASEHPCITDYMEFFDGTTSSAAQIRSKLCGNIRPPPLYSKGNVMHFLFHSDYSGNRHGFKILAESRECIQNVFKL